MSRKRRTTRRTRRRTKKRGKYRRRQPAVTPASNRRMFLSARPQRVSALAPRRNLVTLRHNYTLQNITSVWKSAGRNYGFNNYSSERCAYHVPLNCPSGHTEGTSGAGYSDTGSAQPQFWDQYAALYPYYRVHSAAVTVTLRGAQNFAREPIDVITQVFGVETVDDSLVVPTWGTSNHPMYAKSARGVMQSPYVSSRSLPYTTDGFRFTVKKATKVAKWFGDKQSSVSLPFEDQAAGNINEYVGKTGTTTGTSTLPTKQVWLYIMPVLRSADLADLPIPLSLGTYQIYADVTIEYNMEFMSESNSNYQVESV